MDWLDYQRQTAPRSFLQVIGCMIGIHPADWQRNAGSRPQTRSRKDMQFECLCCGRRYWVKPEDRPADLTHIRRYSTHRDYD